MPAIEINRKQQFEKKNYYNIQLCKTILVATFNIYFYTVHQTCSI